VAARSVARTIYKAGSLFFGVLAFVLLAPAALVALYRTVPPPETPLMWLRGGPVDYRWTPLKNIAPGLARSAVAAEDEGFCTHNGFDRAAIEKAWDAYMDADEDEKATLRGGSTISQQTAKNVFLWPGRTWVRKALEAWITVYVEALWNKKRILEVYLNVVEWGPGIYGAEAAARHHFHKSAAALDTHEAALLASVLPSPLKWSASKPGPYVRGRAEKIAGRASKLGAYANCL
jgi:monofunctional biosynthetic peptidoglycan transglycosylase